MVINPNQNQKQNSLKQYYTLVKRLIAQDSNISNLNIETPLWDTVLQMFPLPSQSGGVYSGAMGRRDQGKLCSQCKFSRKREPPLISSGFQESCDCLPKQLLYKSQVSFVEQRIVAD